jgi:hypothetical protein
MRTLSSLSPVCMGLCSRDYHSNVSESRVDPKDARGFRLNPQLLRNR